MDRLKCMQVFAKVVETGGFTAAAQALDVSRPMASKYVQRLEDELGVRLLNRTTRRVSLTQAGRGFYLKCQNIFADIDHAMAEASNLQITPRGNLRINAPISFGRDHLMSAIASFQNTYPEISVDLTLNDRLVDIVDEGFDLAIRIGRLRDSSLIARHLAPCQLIACAAPSYIEQHGTPQQPSDLAAHNCLIYTYSQESGQWTFEKDGKKEKIAVSGDFRANFGEAVVAAAIAGRGIVVDPSFIVGPFIRSGKLVPILTNWSTFPLGIYAVYPQARLLPLKVRVFIDFLADQFGPEPYWDKGLQASVA